LAQSFPSCKRFLTLKQKLSRTFPQTNSEMSLHHFRFWSSVSKRSVWPNGRTLTLYDVLMRTARRTNTSWNASKTILRQWYRPSICLYVKLPNFHLEPPKGPLHFVQYKGSTKVIRY
jgi:hypothetical protein